MIIRKKYYPRCIIFYHRLHFIGIYLRGVVDSLSVSKNLRKVRKVQPVRAKRSKDIPFKLQWGGGGWKEEVNLSPFNPHSSHWINSIFNLQGRLI